jgi:[ribosomal protein S18]-alanine N-acetyltransferase
VSARFKKLDMQNIKIKRCTLKDLNSVFFLEKYIFGDEGYSRLTLRQLYDVGGDLFRVAVTSADEIVGHTIGCPQAYTSEAWILALAVLPHHQGQGIGRQLTFSLFQEFNKLEIKQVLLTVEPDNKIAIDLYESIGFSLMAYEDNYFGENCSRNVMRKVLSC